MALDSGAVVIVRRSVSGHWDSSNIMTIVLGCDPVSVLLPHGDSLYTCVGSRVMLLDTCGTVTKSLDVSSDDDHEQSTSIGHMAVAGVGLWVCLDNSSIISLYHTESFIHMRDIDIATNVNRVLTARDSHKRSIYVTCLSAAKGLLWVGTNVGIALTIPLPRLEGVPIISGKANISYHAHFGPVRMFLTLNTSVMTTNHETTHGHVSRRHSANVGDHKTIQVWVYGSYSSLIILQIK